MRDHCFGDRRTQRTRKRRQCFECQAMIEPGSEAVEVTGIYDGTFHSFTSHADCHDASRAFMAAIGLGYGDEWPGLREEYCNYPENIHTLRQACAEWPDVVDRVLKGADDRNLRSLRNQRPQRPLYALQRRYGTHAPNHALPLHERAQVAHGDGKRRQARGVA